jgi:ribonuclease PH
MKRADGRSHSQIRPIKITYNVFGYAPGSVLFELGNTKVLCAVSLQHGVPLFLKGKKTGWLTANYSMLPTSTKVRTERVSPTKQNNRAVEISRLIGRSLRCVVNLDRIGERTIVIDCDVLQADGSTRTAAISGTYLALRQAITLWVAEGALHGSVGDYLTDSVAAVSVGVSRGTVFLDVDFTEDNAVDADYNIVLTRSGNIIEIQGSAEQRPISWQDFDIIRTMAVHGVKQLFDFFDHHTSNNYQPLITHKTPLFSLANRQRAVQ